MNCVLILYSNYFVISIFKIILFKIISNLNIDQLSRMALSSQDKVQLA